MTVPQKALFSFLLSALFCAGIAALALTGIIGKGVSFISVPARIVILAVGFLTSFLLIFFCLNFRRASPKTSTGFASADAVQVESLTGPGGSVFQFGQPFAFTPGNPELLQETGNEDVKSEVVYEQNGIHYINNDVFADNKDRAEFDSNFASLVESVVNKKELLL